MLYERLRLYFAEGAADRDGPDDYASMEFESNVEDGQVGVGDGD